MPTSQRPIGAPTRGGQQVAEVVDLLDRYATADRRLALELDDINAEAESSRRVSQATVNRLVALLEDSLVPGVQAKADLNALPRPLRRAGIAQWTRTLTRVQSAATGVAP